MYCVYVIMHNNLTGFRTFQSIMRLRVTKYVITDFVHSHNQLIVHEVSGVSEIFPTQFMLMTLTGLVTSWRAFGTRSMTRTVDLRSEILSREGGKS